MANVILKNVTKVYDNHVTALKDASLEIKDGEFVVLVGPSGCGKSTLLRMIAGLEEITSGDIYIDTNRVNDMPPKNRDIAMVFQNYALYPHMSVYENLAFGLKLRKIPKNEIKERVEEAAKLLDISDLIDRKPKALSGGQRQRVALGRAIVRKPKVFLFDEPLSNLDAKLRVQMRIEVNRLHQRLGSTMIYVTHDQIEAMTMGTRIVVLKDGLVQQVDSPLQLYNHPVNKFVAGFIGSPSMNFFEGVLNRNGADRFHCEVFDLDLPASISKSLSQVPEQQFHLGVRPEDIILYDKNNPQLTEASQPIHIELVEPVGNEIFAYFSDSKNSYCLRANPDTRFLPGAKLNFGFKTENLHFFSNDSEGSNLVSKS